MIESNNRIYRKHFKKVHHAPMKNLICFVFLLLSLSVSGQTISGRIVGISDGYTETVLDLTNTQYKLG